MPSPATQEAFLDCVRKAEVVDAGRLDAFLTKAGSAAQEGTPRQLSDQLVQEGLLTSYQATLLLKGRMDGFKIGPYRILERLGFGAVSNVYLCEHQGRPDLVAVKVMTGMKAKDPVVLKRFYREARASASLTHRNIVRVQDIDWDDQAHFMVMEYIDGSSIQDIVQQFGPLEIRRAAHYISQAAQGLQFAHKGGLVHRDIKPGNLLVDREGIVKILDMGLARFSEEEGEALTQGEVLGSPEYFSPEQAVDSHNVDIRADIYSLGAVLYFMLTGEAPYSEEKTKAAKIIAKEKRPPKEVRSLRPELSERLAAVVEKMMAQRPDQRYQTPAEVVEAVTPWTSSPIEPPPDQEMPKLSRAARERNRKPTAKTSAKAKRRSANAPANSGTPVQWWPIIQVLVFVVLGALTFVLAWIFLGARRPW